MKTIYKLLIFGICILISNSIYSQITVEKAVAIDRDKDGTYDGVELKFSTGINDSDADSPGERDDWEFSIDPEFSSSKSPTALVTNVTEIAAVSTTDDRYIRFNLDEFTTSNGPLYFRYTNNGTENINDSIAATPDTVNNIILKSAIDKAPPYIIDTDGVTSTNTAVGDTLKVGDQITFTVDFKDTDPNLTVYPLQYNGGDLNWVTYDGGDTYKGTYTVVEGHSYQKTPLQLLDVYAVDKYGNPGDSTDPDADGSDITKGIDANTPVINTVTSSAAIGSAATLGDTLIIDNEITFTVTPLVAQDGLRVYPTIYNGQTLTWSTTSPYTATYTVASGEQDQWTPLQLIGVTLKDTAGNVSDPLDGSDVAWAIDANRPDVNSGGVTSVAIGSGDTLMVGDQIIFTVDVVTADGTLSVSPLNYNGQPLNWYTNNGGNTYTGVYTVTEGDPKQNTPLQLENVTLKDPAGNSSDPSDPHADGSDITKGIDATTPVVNAVTSSVAIGSAATLGDTLIIDNEITFTVTPLVAEDGLRVYPKSYNGQPLTWSTTSPYSATYTVTSGDQDHWTPLQLTGVTLKDTAGNISNSFNGSDVAVSIDAHEPKINSVTSDATVPGTLKVGDKITFTADIDVKDGDLIISSNPYNSVDINNWYTNDGGSTYKGVYTVTEGHTDQSSAIDLTGVIATDAAGNISAAVDCNDIAKTIDANSPRIDSVRLLNKPKIVNDIDTLVIYIKNDPNYADYSLILGAEVAGFEISSIIDVDADSLYAVFTITETSANILGSADIDVTGLQLQDLAGNLSNVVDTTIKQSNDPMYTVLPTAKVKGTYDACDGDEVDLVFQLTGSAPWQVLLDSCSVPVIVDNITESPYVYTVSAINAEGGTEPDPNAEIYQITQVTDVNGNINNGELTVATVNVYELPSVSFTNPIGDKTYNINAAAETLVGSPTGGVFSGPGVISYNNTFSPEDAGIGGPYQIEYNYTESLTGCSNSAAINFTVVESDAYLLFYDEDDQWQCDYDSTFVVYGGIIGKDTIIGDIVLRDVPDAIITIDGKTDSVTVDVQKIPSAGTYTLYYIYDDAGVDSLALSFTVESVSSSFSLTNIPNQCEDYDTIFVEAYNFSPAGGTGTYMFSGNIDHYKINDADTNNIYFLPDSIDPGDYTLDYYYTSSNGCLSDTMHRAFRIHSLPDVSFAIGTDTVYNIDQGSSTITGIPTKLGGEFISTLEFIDDNLDGTAVIDPNENDLGNHMIIYTFTDSNTCVEDDTLNILVNKALGNIESSSGSFQFCYWGSSTDTLIGTPNPTDGTAGTFYIDGDSILAESDNRILFNPMDYTAGDHQVKFSYKNGKTPYNVYRTVNIDSIGNIYFVGLDGEYCEDNDNEVELTAFGQDGVMVFTGNGITDDVIDNKAYFNPSNAVLGDNLITYTFTRNYSGCQRVYTQGVKINKTPVVAFYPNERCIVGTDDLLGFKSDTLSSDSVVNWEWKFRSVYTSTDEEPQFQPTVGSNRMILTLESNKGCTNSADSTFYIGTRVDLNFTFENECYGETVLFNILTSSDDIDVDSVRWNFGGFGDADLTDMENPTFKYSESGAYDVIYEEYTKSCGRIADTITINIRPSINLSITDYLEDFEDEPSLTGWVVENLNGGSYSNSWEWGVPAAEDINQASSGQNAFVTNLSGSYDFNEAGMVTSPCFDFSKMIRPMVKIDILSFSENDRDGAVMQYRKSNGDWATIGVPNDGINWYNSYIISGAPANQQLGWTGEIAGNENIGWETAMYRLDELRGRAGVRFRIVFGSDAAGTGYEGFAFDNIQFDERKRIVLLENFININDNEALDILNGVNSSIEKDSLDVIVLNYHTSFPASNDINDFYPSGPSARALYYGVSSVPYSIVDGKNKFSYLSGQDLLESDIHKRMLIDPTFDIMVKQNIQGNELVVSSYVKALQNLNNYRLSVFVAVIEKTVNAGSEKYTNVLRTMLPDAAGTLVEKEWFTGDSVIVYDTWEIPEGVNEDSLVTIVFVQDEDNKEIYQTAFAEEFSTITSDNKLINSNTADYYVYPNPSKEKINIQLNNNFNKEIQVNLYDGLGKLMQNSVIQKGETLVGIDINDLPIGVYYIKLSTQDADVFGIKKIVKTE